ncbi:MAG: hypothetical protein H8D23_18390 [Candidatus Brocadiales bacterium]|nr:hypothetical protein [Candidatus Brocadiales bacterium]
MNKVAVDGGVKDDNFRNLNTIVEVDKVSNLYVIKDRKTDDVLLEVQIQKGTVLNAGVNGVTIEDLLFIAIQELDIHASGPFQCKETHEALAHSHQALGWLISRTRNRVARGVEGKELA